MGYLNNSPSVQGCCFDNWTHFFSFLRLSLPSSLQLYKKESFKFQMWGALCAVCAHFLSLRYLRSIYHESGQIFWTDKNVHGSAFRSLGTRATASVGSCSAGTASRCFLGSSCTGNVTSDIFGTKTWERQRPSPPAPPPVSSSSCSVQDLLLS